MEQLETAGFQFGARFAAACHVDDFKLESLRFVKASIPRHPDGKKRIGRSRFADPERGEFGGLAVRACQAQAEGDCGSRHSYETVKVRHVVLLRALPRTQKHKRRAPP